MVLKEGWLNRQMDQVSRNVENWPEWMKRAGGVDASPEESENAAGTKQNNSEELDQPQRILNL